MEPIVSICIPTYNGSRWLRECLESAMACTLPAEIIIVDDCSSDETLMIAKEIAAKDKRVSVHLNQSNLGLVGNWNRCLEIANGKWIKFLFQDDRLAAGAIEKMIEAAGEKHAFVAARRNFVFADNSSETSRKYYTETVLTLDKLAPDEKLLSSERIVSIAAAHPSVNFIGEPSTVMFRASLVKEIGNFDPTIRQVCDLEYWLRIACRHGICYVPEAQADFYIHDDSTSAKNAGGRKYASTYLDPLRIVDAQLSDEVYEPFRDKLQSSAAKRLHLWLRLRAYEARKNALDLPAKKELENLFTERPHLRRLSGKFLNGLLFRILKIRRGSN